MMVPPANPPESVRCSQCGTRNPNGTLFCETCGELLEFSPPAQPTEDEALPDWLNAAAPQQPPDDSSDWTQPAATDGVPDWAQETEPGSRIAGVPDWLGAAQVQEDTPAEPDEAPEPPPQPAEAEPASADDIPDWLRTATPISSEPPAAPATPASDDEVPDWLTDLESSGGGAEAEGEDAAGWLAELDAERAEETTAEPEEPPAEPKPARDDLPDWLQSAVQAEDTPTAPPSAPETPSESVAETVDDEPVQPVNPVAWLTSPSPDDVSTPPPPDLPDWLSGADFDAEEQPPAGEDLLGLVSDLEAPAEDAVDQPAGLSGGELPEWMVTLSGVGQGDSTKPLQHLRYEAISEEIPGEPGGPERIGALKNVTGVIRPELLFEASTLSVERPVEQLIVSDRQAEQVRRIGGLLAEEGRPLQVSREGAGRLPLLEWVVAAVMVIVTGLALLADAPLFPTAAAHQVVGETYGTLNTLAEGGATVLVVFDYEPDTAAEMQPLADVMLRHLAAGNGATVYTISTRAAGPAMAEAVLAQPALSGQMAASGGTWQNLGYLSGEASGISGLAVGTMPGAISPLAFDAAGQPSGLGFDRLAGGDVDAIIVLASRPEDLRAWVEQAGRPTGIPLVAAVSARAAPLAEPYRDSGQLAGLLAGLNDAVTYAGLAGQPSSASTISLWNVQTVGAMTAAALIVIGGLFYGLLGRIRQERAR